MMICLTLRDGPGSVDDVVEGFRVIGRRFGFYGYGAHRHTGGMSFAEWVQEELDRLESQGMVFRKSSKYSLTREGLSAANQFYDELARAGRLMHWILSPERATFATMIVHFVLAAIKLPAALLSGSVGLLNDSMDTLLDGVASLLVFFGVKKGFERLANRVLVVLMAATALFTLYEAVRRVFERQLPQTDWFTFASVLISAAVCMVLSIYQRLAGTRNQCGALITQSIDSRNHVIAATGVAAGLVAARLDFIWLDIAVGFIVAIIITKSALELAIELIRSARAGEEQPDYSRYALLVGLQDRQTTMRILAMANVAGYRSRNALLTEFVSLLNTESSTALRAVGLHEMSRKEERIERCLDRAFEEGLLVEDDVVRVTEKGLARLSKSRSPADTSGTEEPHGQGALHTILSFVFGAVLFTALYLGLDYLQDFVPAAALWEGNARLPGDAAQWIGVFLGGGVFAVAHIDYRHAVRHIRRARRRSSAPRRLVADGPYARSRHPMYAGMILMYCGLMVALGTRLTCLIAAGYTIVQTVAAFMEDRRMDSLLATEYPDYRLATRTFMFTPLHAVGFALLAGWAIGGMLFL